MVSLSMLYSQYGVNSRVSRLSKSDHVAKVEFQFSSKAQGVAREDTFAMESVSSNLPTIMERQLDEEHRERWRMEWVRLMVAK